MVKIGDWSYSIYLWHWPFIVFAIYIWPLNPYAPVLAALAALVPALASYRWVEEPFRLLALNGQRRFTRLVASVLLPPLLIAGAVGATAASYWLPRYEAGDLPVAHEGDTGWNGFFIYLRDTYYPCADSLIRDNAMEMDGITRCRQSKPGADVQVALVGDNHAEHLFLGLAEAAPDKNVGYFILDALPVDDGAGMSRIIRAVAGNPTIETVIVSAYWADRGAFQTEIAKTLRAFVSAGKQVFVTDDVPTYPFDATACKYSKTPLISISECSQPLANIKAKYSQYYPALQGAVGEVPGVHLLLTTRYFCNGDTCSMAREGRLMYRDGNHLNNTGSRYLMKQLLDDNSGFRAALLS
jgi:hypothetical protein